MAHTLVYLSTHSPFTSHLYRTLAPICVYPLHTLWPPGYSTSILQVIVICEAFLARFSFIFENRKKSDGTRHEMYGGCSKMSQWNCSLSKACVCRAVCGCALSCNRTIARESLPLRQDNLRSHRPAKNKTKHLVPLTVGGILIRHSHGHSYLCTHHAKRSDVQLHEVTLNIALNTRNQWLAATRQVRGLYTQTFFYTPNVLRKIVIYSGASRITKFPEAPGHNLNYTFRYTKHRKKP